ncbi:hypothetical protein [Rasiella sp. SM2506]|uniref:hypothetical protein n=1 Tax=Rasiella sp. SM2506 TaxID=3423914 RepID=UPI003D796207
MKRTFILLVILNSFLNFSCSEQDDESEKENLETFFYSKSTKTSDFLGVVSSQEVLYNSNKKPTKVVTNRGYEIVTLDISYSEGQVSKITKFIDVEDDIYDKVENYEVILENNLITLINSDRTDTITEIRSTNGYVDSFKVSRVSVFRIFEDDRFVRDSENNIISFDGGPLFFEYSNHDKGNNMPSPGLRDFSNDFFIAFNLKTSNKFPLNTKVTFEDQAGNIVTEQYNINSAHLFYDAHNNILKYDSGAGSRYEFEYIKL